MKSIPTDLSCPMAVTWVLMKTGSPYFPSPSRKTLSLHLSLRIFLCVPSFVIKLKFQVSFSVLGTPPFSSIKAEDQLGNPFLSLAKD